MRVPSCNHCNGIVGVDDKQCPHCGMPLLPGQHKLAQKRFIVWFVLITLFCLFMVFWLPPDWTPFIRH